MAGAVVGILAAGAASGQPVDLLPDIIVRQSELFDHQITTEGGRRLLRLSNGTANIGVGKLYVYGVLPPNPDGTQDVNQRVFRSDGSFYDRLAGKFVYHPTHGHIHFENWAQYRLREILPGDGVGPIIAEGGKTSFCILDLQVYNPALPGFDPRGEFRSCGSTIQGLSVGWMDVYSKGLAGQYIDISFVDAGQYWLESEVDPGQGVLESDHTNNITRIKVTITGSAGPIAPDRYEPNDRRDQVPGRPIGAVNSPNLGPVGPSTTLTDLTVHLAGNDDYFRFYNPGPGTASDFIRLSSDLLQGNLSIDLRNDDGVVLSSSQSSTSGVEQLSLSGRPRGWYYVRVFGHQLATSPRYSLTINPAQSAPPVISTLTPPAGDIQLTHGVDTYRVEWTASDPDGDPTWVTVYLNTKPQLDGHEIQIPTSLHSPGELGFHVINSAYVDPGTYWAYTEVTDGGVKTGSWSPGTVTFVELCVPDLDHDGHVDFPDFLVFLTAYDEGSELADFTGDGMIDFADYLLFLELYNEGCHEH